MKLDDIETHFENSRIEDVVDSWANQHGPELIAVAKAAKALSSCDDNGNCVYAQEQHVLDAALEELEK